MSSVLFSIVNIVFLALYHSSLYSVPYFLAAPRAKQRTTVETIEARKCGTISNEAEYRIEMILQGNCSILDTFIFNQYISGLISVDKLYDWASYVSP